VLALTSCSKKPSTDPLAVVGGTLQANYRFPWVVKVQGTLQCHAVLIHPKWVLTAGHCVATQASYVWLSRTDPYTGFVKELTREVKRVHLHPNFNPSLPEDYDIALLELKEPFEINWYIQTVGLPSTPRQPGVMGTIASYSLTTSTLPPGKLAIFRAAIPQDGAEYKISIYATSATGSLCPGDSGSGLTTYENERATVRGITANADGTPDCAIPTGGFNFTDVFFVRDWIRQETGMTDYDLAGNTRMRWTGGERHGTMGIICSNPYGPMSGPVGVPGVELGANCGFDQPQTAFCRLEQQTGAVPVEIIRFSMKTFPPDGSPPVEQSLPFSPTWAVYNGELPSGHYREFTCRLGFNIGNDQKGNKASPQ
jgi:hypothetical protein